VIGSQINNYELVSVLGQGGMGTVYLACHTFTGRKAAVKLLHPELARDQAQVTRFMNEARATAAIGHPNIIDIIDVGVLADGRTPYLMMEFLQGESLSSRLQRSRPLPFDEAIEIACQTASALSAAHRCEIIHRDLKPDNLYLLVDSSTLPVRLRVKVLDFGIAKLRADLSGESVKTRTGAIMGTPQYMSPEQCRGFAQQIDYRTDIYTLGVILYEMVCGSPPFVSEGLGDLLMMQVGRPPIPPRTLSVHVPDVLDEAIMRALAKDPNQRFASMADFEEALRLVEGPSTTAAGSAGQGQARDPRRARLPPNVASWVTPPAPTRLLAAETDGSEGTPIGDAPKFAGTNRPGTTFTATAGQVLTAQTQRTRRHRFWVRPALVASGVLVTAALVVYAIMQHEGRTAPAPGREPPSAPSVAPSPVPVPPLPEAAVPAAAPADSITSAATTPARAIAPGKPRPVPPKDKRADHRRDRTAIAAPAAAPLPKPAESPAPPPVPKPANTFERW